MAKNLPPTATTPKDKEDEKNPWMGKNQVFNLFQEIDEYVTSYTADHQSELNSKWLALWHYLYHTAHVGKSSTSFQVTAITITDDVNASLEEVVNTIKRKIPGLDKHLTIHKVSKRGMI